MEQLPAEIVDIIFTYFNSRDLPLLRLVCKDWRAKAVATGLGPTSVTNAITYYVEQGYIELVKAILPNIPSKSVKHVLDTAIRTGCAELTKHIVARKMLNTGVASSVCTGGDLDLLMWVIDSGEKIDMYYCVNAALVNNHLHIVKWLCGRNPDVHFSMASDTIYNVIKRGSAETVEYMISCLKIKLRDFNHELGRMDGYSRDALMQLMKYPEIQVNIPMVALTAAKTRDVPLMRFALENGYTINSHSSELVNAAIRAKSLSIVELLCDSGYQPTASNADIALSYEGMNILDYFCSIGCKPSNARAASSIKTVLWCIDNGCTVDCSQHIITAVLCGDLNALKILHGHCGGTISSNICKHAVERGDLEMLKWIREHGGILNESVARAAATDNTLEILKWLHENGCPWDADVLKKAFHHAQPAAFRYAYENGCPFPN